MGKKKTVTKETPLGKLLKSCKIESLPKTVQDSIPYTHVFNDGIIETRPGNFTIEFKLEDVNFQIATDESQMEIFSDYMTFLNSFDKEVNGRFFCRIISSAEKMSLKNQNGTTAGWS